jgi:hypothetical protein
MAMIDYGAIAWKNGKLISTDMFTPMKDMVGWEDSSEGNYSSIKDNYFAYIGDEEFIIAFYKSYMRMYNPITEHNEEIFFGSERFYKWKEWADFFTVGKLHDFVRISVKPRKFHNYYICKMEYKNNKYKVAFGYGVDLSYYKKYHIIDYYGTPWFKIKSIYRRIKGRIKYGY